MFPNLGIEQKKNRGRYWLLVGVAGTATLAWSAGRLPTAADRAPVADTAAVVELTDPAAEPVDSPADRVIEPVAGASVPEALGTPIAQALRAIEDCQERYEGIRDYVCTFVKRERIDGRLNHPHKMLMKARTRPRSIYLKFKQPGAGREAIFIEGRNDNKVLAHDVGLGRLIAGTLHLDPKGSRAMTGCRHPITEAGIGPLLDTLEARWTTELDSNETRVEFRETRVGSRPCQRITVAHSRQSPDFMFHKVHLFIDNDLGLPIHFEAYDWPAAPGDEPTLIEEYSYNDLELNVGLSDNDFDVSNTAYAFGRF